MTNQEIQDESTLKLANRLNELEVLMNNLELERLMIIKELERRYPTLQNDDNLKRL